MRCVYTTSCINLSSLKLPCRGGWIVCSFVLALQAFEWHLQQWAIAVYYGGLRALGFLAVVLSREDSIVQGLPASMSGMCRHGITLFGVAYLSAGKSAIQIRYGASGCHSDKAVSSTWLWRLCRSLFFQSQRSKLHCPCQRIPALTWGRCKMHMSGGCGRCARCVCPSQVPFSIPLCWVFVGCEVTPPVAGLSLLVGFIAVVSCPARMVQCNPGPSGL